MKLAAIQIETLWTLFTAPLIWAVHFLACYVAASIYCEKAAGLPFGFDTVRAGIATATAAALGLIVLSAWLGWRQWGFGRHEPPHAGPTLDDRRRFQGFATLLLSGLSFVAVLLVAMPVLFIAECWR